MTNQGPKIQWGSDEFEKKDKTSSVNEMIKYTSEELIREVKAIDKVKILL